ncbi:MAG: MBL fold metallo-hydrolase [Acidobacteriota bacterium]|jgi:metallo-beta-lactamase family protein
MAELTFLGAAGTVTGSRHLLEIGERRILVDCGLFQGPDELEARNREPLGAEPSSIDAVVLTHAHIDHTGYLPRLVRDGFDGPILGTAATADLLTILLSDSGHLQEEEARYRNRHLRQGEPKIEPLYTGTEGARTARRVRGVHYREPVEVVPGVKATFRRAGHILGSATVELVCETGLRIVFSGDLGQRDAPILPDPAPLPATDYVVVESTYGDREHDETPVEDQLERVIRETAERRGVLLIPAFAVGRTQELVYTLGGMEREGRIPVIPTFVDSPMAQDATRIYRDHPEDFEQEVLDEIARGIRPLRSKDFRMARSVGESKAINRMDGPVVIISASGMLSGGRILHHLKRRLPDPRTTLLFTGYQAEGTRGRRVLDGAESVRIFGRDVPIRARVETIQGLSAHADASELMDWLATAPEPPKRAFVVHGEPGPAETLASRMRDELGWRVSVPEHGASYRLEG